MSITLDGRLRRAIPDDCVNYDPIKSEPKNIWSLKSGRLYKCRHWEENERILIQGYRLEDACLFCKNWVTPDGEHHNRPPEDAALILYEKEKYNDFIQYFQNKDDTCKKKILKKIFESDSVNEKIIEWLNKNESKLVREVGISII